MLTRLFSFSAFCVLLLKIPSIGQMFGIPRCGWCSSIFYPLTLPAILYFLTLFFISYKVTVMPPLVRYFGMIWSIGLGISLTYISPMICKLCVISHALHIMAWLFWRPLFANTSKTSAAALYQ